MQFGGITVTVQRAIYDRYSDATYTDHHTVEGCLEYPTDSVENGAALTDLRTLLTPNGADIKHTDRVLIRGVAYQVRGLAKEWIDPFTGWSPGTQVDLERVT